WIINSVRNRPLDAPEPRLLGQARPTDEPASSRSPASPAAPQTFTAPAPSAPLKKADVVKSNGKPQGTPTPFHPPRRMPSSPSAIDATQVMLRYQDLMERFLETQRSLMSSYLQGYGGPDPGLLPPLAKIEEGNGHHPAPLAGLAIPSPDGTPAQAPAE